jgi:capsular polysaccharide transport system permease protein
VTALWLFAIAAPRYVSEASFIVRSTTPNAADAFARAVQANTGAARAVDETYVVNNYLTSRDVVGLLVKNNDLRAILSRPQADFIFRYPTFWRAENSESLYRRFRWMVSADIDTATNISKVEVNAFRPEDARAITVALLGYAEELVNKLNARAYEDAQRTANRFVEIASQDIAAIEVELKDFRNASGVVDPSVEADAQLKLIAALWTALARVEATIAKNSALSPNNPGLKSLKEQARAYRETIEKRKLEMAGSSASMAAKLEKFDQLMLRRTLAVKTLESAVANREKARQDASQQHLYIQLVAKPSLSVDYATYPHSVRDILGVLVFSLIVFYLLNCLRQITSEHRT